MEKINFETKNGKPYYGGSLDLRGTGITVLPEGLTVGGYLDLRGTGITVLPEGLTVCGYLDLRGTGITDPKYTKINSDNYLFSCQGGKYIKCDGIFAEVLQKRGNVFKVKQFGNSKQFFVVTNGAGKYAHGDTLKEAKRNLIFKISDRNKSDYESLTTDSILTYEKAIECYRVITGACAFGSKDFVVNRLTQKKKEYTIREIITLTKGEWGNSTFANFFK